MHVLLYGYRSKGCFVWGTAETEEGGERRLAMLRSIWGRKAMPYADKFTLHPAEDVLSSVTKKGYVLKPEAKTAVAPAAKKPEGLKWPNNGAKSPTMNRGLTKEP